MTTRTTHRAPLPAHVAALYPFDEHVFETAPGIWMHYVDEGPRDAPVVVMVHGNPTWSFYFRRLVLRLRGRFRCIVPDHIGCGLSDIPDDDDYPYTLARRVDDLEALLAHCGVDRASLVAHDWGGMIASGWATRHPERVERLAYLNTAAFHLPPDESIPFALTLCRSPLGALLVRGANAFCRSAVAVGTKRHKLTPAERDGYLWPYGSWHARLAVHRFVQDIPLSPSHPSDAEVCAIEAGMSALTHVPTHVFWGMRDFVFTPAFLDEWRRRAPHATFTTFADAGHYVLDDAFDEIAAGIDELLATEAAEP